VRECEERWRDDVVFQFRGVAFRRTRAQCSKADGGAWCGCAAAAGARGACGVERERERGRGVLFLSKGFYSERKRHRGLRQQDFALRSRPGWSLVSGASGSIFFVGLARGTSLFPWLSN
jgi:hypothetical protein